MRLPALALSGAVAALAAPAPAGPARAADSVRVLLAIGSNVGDPSDQALRYAEADAERMRSLLVDIGGVSADRAYLVVGQPAEIVRERLSEVAGRVAELAAAGQEVVLIVYASAHARDGVLHLRGTHLPLAELRDRLAHLDARLRLLIVDACDSGMVTRAKGGTPGPEYQVALEQLRLQGQVIVSSSGPAEPSLEADALSGSLFTHHLLTALRGDADADGDGVVTLHEAYSYTYRRTVLAAGFPRQHPTFDLDVHGAGELALSQPLKARAALVFPASLAGQYVISTQPRPDMVAEIDKEAGKPLRLALAPGRYLLRKRDGRRVGLCSVELPYGGDVTVDDRQLQWRDYAQVVSKGAADLDPSPGAVLALLSLESPPLEGTGARWRVQGGFQLGRAEWWGLASAGLGYQQYRGLSLTTSEVTVAAGLVVGYRWPQPDWPVVPLLGVAAEVEVLHQSFVRDDEATIQRVFGQGPLPPRLTAGVRGGPVVGLELPLWRGAFASAQARVEARYLPAEDQPALTLGAGAQVGIGWRL
ncbi:MAG TPA: caspase family protein [Myxococcales bacterium]|nr:caspase family protein [Myxococcales bacterium]